MKRAIPILLGTWLAALALPGVAAERTGEQIVKAKCANCHATGLHGAPRIDDRAAWVPRLKSGLDATVLSAIRGHGNMPARGGMADLTDGELRSAVLYLFNPAGPPKPPPPAAPLGANQRVVDNTEIYLGVKRVKDGVYHVNVTLRDATTHAPIAGAKVEASVTNPVMGTDTRALLPTPGKAVSYGADFRMTGREPHVVTVQIRRPDTTRVIETKFDFKG